MTKVAEGLNQTEARIAYHDIEKRAKPGFYKEGGKHATPHIKELDPDNFAQEVLQVGWYNDTICVVCGGVADASCCRMTRCGLSSSTLISAQSATR
jgi:hypothetical protein